ncbi:MAG TPA: aldo/keto reductase [Polyangiaceae bacterium]
MSCAYSMMERLALGCLRAGESVIAAALDAGVRTFDTARAYGESERTLGALVAGRDVRVVTKGGMKREGAAWRPDGRARALRADLDASLEALGVPIDTYLVHAPDPAVAWSTTIRELARIASEKVVGRVGVCNVTRPQLDEALDLAPISVVQIPLGAGLDEAIRSGVVARCIERGVAIMAHSPFGGPKRASRLARDATVRAIAERLDASPYAIVLAMLLDLHPSITVAFGTSSPDHLRAALAPFPSAPARRADGVTLDDAARDALDARFGLRSALAPRRAAPTDAEVVLLMGIQGSGKSTAATAWTARGYERLNRDERGGTLRGLHAELGERLAAGAKRVVLDNTYVTRSQRWDVLRVAAAHGAIVRGIFHATSLADAQVNVIGRMLETHGRLLEPREMERAKDPSALAPNVLFRAHRELEPPELDEGFASLETIAFTRARGAGRPARFVALEAASGEHENVIVFAWRAAREILEKYAPNYVHCAHDDGPPRCWCRPPLPGLLLAYARAYHVDLARSVVVGANAAHARMAAAVGARYESVSSSAASRTSR